jgi:small subunit ribosomal protein S6
MKKIIKNEPIIDAADQIDPRVYEVSYIFVDTLDDEEAVSKANALKESIATLGGSFIAEETPYLRELAYEMVRVIKNQNNRFNQGYFGWIKTEIDPSKIALVDKTLKLDEDIIRHLVLKADREVHIFTKRNPVVKAKVLEEVALEAKEAEAAMRDISDTTELPAEK